MIANTEVLKHLASLCHAQETGTFFITTTENKACHIILETGRITALSYVPQRGHDVIPQLPFMKVERFSFQQRIKMPLASKAFLDDSVNVLESLGLHHSDTESASTKRFYRGVEMEVSPQIPSIKKSVKETGTKKPPRMYRGRILND